MRYAGSRWVSRLWRGIRNDQGAPEYSQSGSRGGAVNPYLPIPICLSSRSSQSSLICIPFRPRCPQRWAKENVLAGKKARATKKLALAIADQPDESAKLPPGQKLPNEEPRPIDWSAWLRPERRNSLIPEGVDERKRRESALSSSPPRKRPSGAQTLTHVPVEPPLFLT